MSDSLKKKEGEKMNDWILICVALSGLPIAVILILLRKNEKVASIFHSFGKTEHIIVGGLVVGGILLIVSAVFAIAEFEKAAFGFIISAALVLSIMQGIAFSGINEENFQK